MSEQEIIFSDDGVAVGKLLKSSVQPEGLQTFVEQYNDLLGSVKYQPWLRGVLAGLTLAFGVPRPLPESSEAGVVSTEPAKERETSSDGHGGLTPSRSPESETIVPVSESPAAVANPEASGAASP